MTVLVLTYIKWKVGRNPNNMPYFINAVVALWASETHSFYLTLSVSLSFLCDPKINLLMACRNPLISQRLPLAFIYNAYLFSSCQQMCEHTGKRRVSLGKTYKVVNICLSSRRDDCSIFDGLMEEDEKDKAKR